MIYKNIDNALKMCKSTYITLDNIISGRFYHVNKGHTNLKIRECIHIEGLLNIIGGRQDYSMNLRDLISRGKSCGILERLVYNGKRWTYIAGQDYPNELNTIRKILREGL